jgi:hypothetical protein
MGAVRSATIYRKLEGSTQEIHSDAGCEFVVGLEQASVPADPREILHGLKAVQDDAEKIGGSE